MFQAVPIDKIYWCSNPISVLAMKKKGGYKKKGKSKNYNYYKKKYQKKKWKKKYGKNKSGRAGLLVPTTYKTIGYRPFIKAVGIYNYGGTLTLAGGSYSPLVWNGNDPYDPYYAAGGTSCLNWTELYGLGKGYYCYASRMSVRVLPSTASTTNDTRVYLVASQAASIPYASIPDLAVQLRNAPGCRSQAIRQLGDPNKNYPLILGRRTKTMLPMTNPADLRTTSMSASPARTWQYILGAYDNIGSADTTAPVRFELQIHYFCLIFNDPPIASG